MSTLELRSRLRELIDATKSEELLQHLYELLHGWGSEKESGVWSSLMEAERNRVLKAYSTAMDPRNLSTTEDVLKRRKACAFSPYGRPRQRTVSSRSRNN